MPTGARALESAFFKDKVDRLTRFPQESPSKKPARLETLQAVPTWVALWSKEAAANKIKNWVSNTFNRLVCKRVKKAALS
jgi:hypothetical protein